MVLSGSRAVPVPLLPFILTLLVIGLPARRGPESCPVHVQIGCAGSMPQKTRNFFGFCSWLDYGNAFAARVGAEPSFVS